MLYFLVMECSGLNAPLRHAAGYVYYPADKIRKNLTMLPSQLTISFDLSPDVWSIVAGFLDIKNRNQIALVYKRAWRGMRYSRRSIEKLVDWFYPNAKDDSELFQERVEEFSQCKVPWNAYEFVMEALDKFEINWSWTNLVLDSRSGFLISIPMIYDAEPSLYNQYVWSEEWKKRYKASIMKGEVKTRVIDVNVTYVSSWGQEQQYFTLIPGTKRGATTLTVYNITFAVDRREPSNSRPSGHNEVLRVAKGRSWEVPHEVIQMTQTVNNVAVLRCRKEVVMFDLESGRVCNVFDIKYCVFGRGGFERYERIDEDHEDIFLVGSRIWNQSAHDGIVWDPEHEVKITETRHDMITTDLEYEQDVGMYKTQAVQGILNGLTDESEVSCQIGIQMNGTYPNGYDDTRDPVIVECEAWLERNRGSNMLVPSEHLYNEEITHEDLIRLVLDPDTEQELNTIGFYRRY